MKSIVENMIGLFAPGRRQNQTIGLELSAQGIAFAQVQRHASQQPLLTQCEFIPADADLDTAELLRSQLLKLSAQKIPVNIVMGAASYQLILGEAPKVPEAELAEALRWRVKDLVQYPIAEAIVDGFFLPEDSARGTSRMAYTAVTQRSTVEQLVAIAKSAGANLKNIDIPELALRNLAETCCDTKRGVALVKLQQGGGSLHIIRAGNLYLSRQFSLSYNAGLLDDLPVESLVLELQRSLDYFERQMRQVPPSHIYLCGENVSADKLTPELINAMAVKIQLLDIAQGMQLAEHIAEHNLALCLTAIGAALREDQVGQA